MVVLMYYNYRWRWTVRRTAIYRLKKQTLHPSPTPTLSPTILTLPTVNSHSNCSLEEVDRVPTHTHFGNTRDMHVHTDSLGVVLKDQKEKTF